ncbi:MAG: hemin uptake protein HemP [Xanthomonadales bacterium]|nr:hemin uptake protein HemP [Xanthomonadales bacterium]
MDNRPNPALPARSRASRPLSDGSVAFDSRALLQGAREVLIRHGDQTYRLYHTRNDKLILVK